MAELTGNRILVLGAGPFAEEVADLISGIEGREVVGFVEGRDRTRCERPLLGLPVVWIDEVKSLRNPGLGVCAVGSTKRSRFVQQASDQGLRFTRVVHPTAHLPMTTTLDEGVIVSPHVVVGAHAAIGRHVILSRGVLIGHHTTVCDFVTVSPGANIAGRVRVGEGAYVGMGAIVLDGVSIGRHALVGAGAVVTRDVPEAVQVVGVPARIVKHLSPEAGG